MTSTAQRKMILPGEATRCVLLDIRGVRSRLSGHDEDDVLALIEQDGLLPWAWNIGIEHPPRFKHAMEIRVLSSCVDHYAATGKRVKAQWREVLAEIFVGITKPFITGKEARLILNCSSTQISNFLTTTPPELKPLAGTNWTTGPKGSAIISCESFAEFLSRRFVVTPEEML
jgi:hypothetical protein